MMGMEIVFSWRESGKAFERGPLMPGSIGTVFKFGCYVRQRWRKYPALKDLVTEGSYKGTDRVSRELSVLMKSDAPKWIRSFAAWMLKRTGIGDSKEKVAIIQ
jgi:hypothetical protein